MPRKAKPLRMWAVYGWSRFYEVEMTRKASIKGFMEMAGPERGWRYWRRRGYRAVRVTVREDTNGR